MDATLMLSFQIAAGSDLIVWKIESESEGGGGERERTAGYLIIELFVSMAIFKLLATEMHK